MNNKIFYFPNPKFPNDIKHKVQKNQDLKRKLQKLSKSNQYVYNNSQIKFNKNYGKKNGQSLQQIRISNSYGINSSKNKKRNPNSNHSYSHGSLTHKNKPEKKENSVKKSNSASKKLITSLHSQSVDRNMVPAVFNMHKISKTKKYNSVLEKNSPSSQSDSKMIMKWSARTRQGIFISNPNKVNQDSYLIENQIAGTNNFVCSVADGHGVHGHFVTFITQDLMNNSSSNNDNKKQKNVINYPKIFSRIQKELQQKHDKFSAECSGSTLICLFINNNNNLYCANTGDSRAIMGRQTDKKCWEVIHLSQDHKLSLEKERKRIISHGGRVHSFKGENGKPVGPLRAWLPHQNIQGLAMSRSIGDNISKPIGVTHQPQIIHIKLETTDKFILVASDGVWEFLTNYEILQLIVPYYKDDRLEQCCNALMKLAYQKWTVVDSTVIDDITFILIFIK